ncbi:MAG: primosomal protein N', partial [Endozoicomonadaceae bacterium]|nr:primosomal protein N' [Endozoicomonadaceae bacterium]
MPPLGRLAAIIISADDNDAALAAATSYVREAHASRPRGIEVLGPIAAPLAVLRGRFRYRVLLKCEIGVAPQSFLRNLSLRFTDTKFGVNFRIDIDPINFY